MATAWMAVAGGCGGGEVAVPGIARRFRSAKQGGSGVTPPPPPHILTHPHTRARGDPAPGGPLLAAACTPRPSRTGCPPCSTSAPSSASLRDGRGGWKEPDA